MKRNFIAICVLGYIALTSCQHAPNNAPKGGYIITGIITGADTGWIYLQHADTSSSVIDSIRINGKEFTFTGKLSGPSFAYIWVGQMERGKFLSFFLTDTDMNIEFYADSATKSKVTPTPEENVYNEYSKLLLPNKDKMNVLIEEAGKLSANGQSEDRKKEIYDSLGKIYIGLQNDNINLMGSFVKNHPNSVVSAWAIATSSLMYEPDLNKLKELYSQLTQSALNNQYANRVKKLIEMNERLAVGSIAPDFTANDTMDKPVSLSSLRGKYLLLDFWASWCHPCREENPNIVENYKKFKDRNFTILQVSLDDNKNNWLKAIHDDELTWTQVSDLKGWSSNIAALYGIQSIPSNFLLDPSGKIIAHNLRAEALQDTLLRVLGNK